MRHKFSNLHLIFKVKIGKYIEGIFNFLERIYHLLCTK